MPAGGDAEAGTEHHIDRVIRVSIIIDLHETRSEPASSMEVQPPLSETYHLWGTDGLSACLSFRKPAYSAMNIAKLCIASE